MLKKIINGSEVPVAGLHTETNQRELFPIDAPEGTIVQYTGVTNALYTNGYFYKRGQNSWEPVDVQNVSNRATKVTGATLGNLAGLDANGNLTDSEVAASEIPALWKSQGEYGVKNLIPYPYDTSSITQRGITFNANSDGTVSFNGTADNDNPAVMQIKGKTASERLLLKAGTYTVSDGNTKDTYGGISLYFFDNNTDNTAYSGTFTGLYKNGTPQVYIWTTQSGSGFAVDSLYGYSKTFTIDSDAYVVVQARSTSYIISTLVSGTIYPMLRIADDTDDIYRPYAKTNKQLTDEISGNTSDIDEIDERLDNTTTAVTGNPISITGLKSNQLAINPVVTLEPIQAGSGDPSPSNVRAISGYDKVEVLSCSVNLFPEDKIIHVHYSIIDGSAGASPNSIATGFMPVKPSTEYYCSISAYSRDSNCRICFYDANKNFITYTDCNTSSKIFATSSNTKFVTIYWDQTDSPAVYRNDFMFCENTITDKTYVPHHKTTSISESLGQTVYWGRLNVRTGEFEVLGKIVDMGDLSWDYNSASNRLWFITPAQTDAESYSDETTVRDIVASAYSAASLNSITSDATLDGVVGLSTTKRIVVRNSAYSDAATFKTAMTGQKIVYKLDTPFTIQLTPHEIPLLKDYAYVSTNGINMQFSYKNGEIASLGDVAQLGQMVNELGSQITNNNLGSIIDLSAYNTESNMYTFPSDGYLLCRCASAGSKLFGVIAGASSTAVGTYIELEYVTQAASISTYVRKGMRTYLYSSSADIVYGFIPLI